MKKNLFSSFGMVLTAIIAAVFIAAWAFILYESYSYRSETEVIGAEIKQAAKKDAYLTSIRNILRGTEGDVDILASRFISEEDVPKFIESLEKTSEEAGLKASMGGVAIDSVVKDSPFRILRVRLSAEGAWKDAVSFINSVDAGPYGARFDRVSLSKNNEGALWTLVADISQYVK